MSKREQRSYSPPDLNTDGDKLNKAIRKVKGEFTRLRSRIAQQNEQAEPVDASTENYVARAKDVDQYKPRFLGRGANSLVFDIPRHPDLVVKVDHALLRRTMEMQAREGLIDAKELPEGYKVGAERELKTRRESLRKTEEYFGKWMPRTRMSLRAVPVNHEMLTAAFSREFADDFIFDDDMHTVWTIVEAQERLPEDADRSEIANEVYSIGWRYKEGSTGPEDYQKLNELFLDGTRDFSEVEFSMSSHPGVLEMHELIVKQEQLRTLLADFLDAARRYTKETGGILDLAGRDNLVVFATDIGWDMVAPDIAYEDGFQEPIMDRARRALDQLLNTEKTVDDADVNALMNVLNYLRTINGYTMLIGGDEMLQLTDEPLGPKSARLIERMQAELARISGISDVRAEQVEKLRKSADSEYTGSGETINF